MDKKAELSITMIVVIILALLILVILVYVFFNSSDTFRSETACLSEGGRCMTSCPSDVDPITGVECPEAGDTSLVCCRLTPSLADAS